MALRYSSTVEAILPGQIWAYVPSIFRLGSRQDSYFVEVLRVENGVVSCSLIPGPQFQTVAFSESQFRRRHRFMPGVVATSGGA